MYCTDSHLRGLAVLGFEIKRRLWWEGEEGFISVFIFCFPGFPHTLICSLNNTSLVPMTFKLRIPGDGVGHKSISSCEQYSDNRRPIWNKDEIPVIKPQEFTITPDRGTIRPQGFAPIRVKCTAFQHTQPHSPTLQRGATCRVCTECSVSGRGSASNSCRKVAQEGNKLLWQKKPNTNVSGKITESVPWTSISLHILLHQNSAF